MENKILEKPLELMILKFDKNVILHPKEIVITDYLRETVSFSQENASSLGSGKRRVRNWMGF